jgi:hypothetical protein
MTERVGSSGRRVGIPGGALAPARPGPLAGPGSRGTRTAHGRWRSAGRTGDPDRARALAIGGPDRGTRQGLRPGAPFYRVARAPTPAAAWVMLQSEAPRKRARALCR